jgi:serine/threonine protein phosphatase 1
MLRNLLKSRAPAPPPEIPPGRRIYAIGDVHGCAHLLDRLLAAIDADDAGREPAATTLIFLGDLVDRGPDSAEVVARVLGLHEERPDVRLLLGNHEEVFLAALDGDPRALKLFTRIGGRETAISYGIAPAAYESMSYDELAAALAAAVPPDHRTFLAGGTEMEIIGDYAFVHAGVRPGRPFDQQQGTDLRWIRDSFLHHRTRMEKIVVHGHTICEEVEFRPHRIGVDTGAYQSGKLSALALEGDRSWALVGR